jgi:Flp pilus assembly protein TadG
MTGSEGERRPMTLHVTTRHGTASARGSSRRGVVTLELIIALPILVILLIAIIEFAMILSVSKHVEFASRVGAKLAAETPETDLGTLNAGGLKQRIDEYLLNAGLSQSCTVVLEHNVAAAGNPVQVDGGGCNCEATGGLPASVPVPAQASVTVESVRVTVCLPIVGNVPNALSTFGLDFTGHTLQHSTAWRYEPGQ